jgi:two-component system sensor histidine kinase VanS
MKNNKITFKIFYITTGLLVISALIIYLTLYFLLPNYYYNHKENTLQSEVNSFINQIEHISFQEAEPLIVEFGYDHNVRLVIQNLDLQLLYFPVNIGRRLPRDIIRDRSPIQIPWRDSSSRVVFEEELMRSDVILISKDVMFENDPSSYRINVIAPLQPIDEASEVILMFLPYMTIPILVISMLGAFMYSNLISKPLLTLNRTAKKMAELDFSTKSQINSNDELGELSTNLNKLAENLKINMDELKEANLQLKNDIQKEREQEEKRREFIATISHELKTPITAVSGQLEGMIHEIGVYQNRDKYLRQSYQVMKEMEKLVYEILDVSQLESFHFTPQFQKLNISELVNRTKENFLYFKEEKDMKFITDIEPNLYIQGDEKLLTKAVANVISNAVMYSREREKVKFRLRQDNKKTELLIINTGTQIEEEELVKIFQPFYRMEKSRSRKTGGSGLGLYIVKKVLDLHKADYSITNVDEGVMFRVEFRNSEIT